MSDHDPLCPVNTMAPGEGGCFCSLVARVRADEAERTLPRWLDDHVERMLDVREAEIRERIAQECERTGNHHGAAIARGDTPTHTP